MVNQNVISGLVIIVAISIILYVVTSVKKNKKKTKIIYSGKRSAFILFDICKPVKYKYQNGNNSV